MRRILAANVTALRTERGWTYEAAAGASGLDGRQWARVEDADNSATLRTIAKLADALGVEAGVLLLKRRK